MTYIPQYKSNFKASVTMRRGYGFCVSKALLLSTLARAVGIPAKIHIVDIINHKISQRVIDLMGTNAFHCHGYSELYLDGNWIKLSPNFDMESAAKGGFFPTTEFDGVHDALFPHYDEKGNKFVEYIGDRGSHIDLPLDEIVKVFDEKYGNFHEMSYDKIKKPMKKEPLTLNK